MIFENTICCWSTSFSDLSDTQSNSCVCWFESFIPPDWWDKHKKANERYRKAWQETSFLSIQNKYTKRNRKCQNNHDKTNYQYTCKFICSMYIIPVMYIHIQWQWTHSFKVAMSASFKLFSQEKNFPHYLKLSLQ